MTRCFYCHRASTARTEQRVLSVTPQRFKRRSHWRVLANSPQLETETQLLTITVFLKLRGPSYKYFCNRFSSGWTPRPSWIVLKSFVCNLDLHCFILEKLCNQISPERLSDPIKNNVLLVVTVHCALNCTELDLLTINSQ